jgi:threonine/homoserine/homoserine lactone efflux protein
MKELFPSWPLMSAFLAASFLLAITPGPGVFYVVTRTLAQGRRVGLLSVAGVAVGNLGNALSASIGLAALFAISSVVFTIVEYAGAAYLIYLGIGALRAPRAEYFAPPPQETRPASAHVFRDGFIVALFNPKTAMFFAAFLPQFLSSASSSMMQSIALGSLFVAIAATTDCVYALAAGAVAPALSRASSVRSFGRYLSASAFFGLGLFTALGSSRAGK